MISQKCRNKKKEEEKDEKKKRQNEIRETETRIRNICFVNKGRTAHVSINQSINQSINYN